MFTINLKIAWRNLVKDSQFTLLNIIGLTTGLACAILIYFWVSDERGIDKFHANDSRLYQVMAHISLPDGIHTQEYTPWLLAKALGSEMPEIEYAIPVQAGEGMGMLSVDEKHLKATPQYVDENFFRVFSYRFIQGDKDHLFADPNAVLLSDEMAMKLFHSTKNIIGKTIHWGYENELHTISGIFERPARNSSARFDILFGYQSYFEKNAENSQNWSNSSPYTYLVIKKGTDVNRLNHKIAGFLQTKSVKSPLTLSLIKYSDKYLHGNYENGVQAGGRIQYVQMFSIIAIFILALACINFMNLSTAKASGRLKEVGIKKCVGASRASLVGQYLAESMLMAFLSLIFAIALVLLLLPEFNSITGRQVALHLSAAFVLPVLAITFLTGFMAGIYPAFYLSGFKPVAILKGTLRTSWGEGWIRKGLVIFQYTLSIVFMVSVLVIYKQMKLVQTIHLGYNKDNVISFNKEGQLIKHFQPFIAEIKKIPGVAGVASLDGDLAGHSSGSTENLDWEGRPPGKKIYFMALDVDYDLMDMLKMKMAAGRNFSRNFGTDSLAIILNTAAVEATGLTNPIGKTIKVWGGLYHIIGVVENFHFESLYEKVKPCFIRCFPEGRNILVKINPGQELETIATLGKLYQQYNPGLPLEFTFMDQNYQAMYVSEQRVSVLSRYFAGLAILISCLGLFGLATFTAQKRRKEIGIRKVIGATVSNLVLLLSIDFFKLLLIAVLIAFPLSWLAMKRWLNGFAYHTHINASVFLIAGTSIIFITLLSISFQSVKAAVANPVKSLRTSKGINQCALRLPAKTNPFHFLRTPKGVLFSFCPYFKFNMPGTEVLK